MRRLFVLGLVFTASCGAGSGAGGAPPSAAAPASQAAAGGGAIGPGPALVSAALADNDRNGVASAGDEIVLGFDRDADLSGLTVADLRLLSGADTLGAGASVAPRGLREAVVRLGGGAALSLYETYMPGSAANRSPAAIWIDVAANPAAVRGPAGEPGRAGRPVPVIVDRATRLAFQGTQSRGSFSPYRGQMHSHTTFSDGQGGEPAQAFDMARYQAGLDWFMVSDHFELIFPISFRWPETKRQADARNLDGTFVTLTGYEWSYGFQNIVAGVMYNHCNVVTEAELLDFALSASLAGMYRNVQRLSDDAIGKFNHPGVRSKSAGSFTISYNNWNDYLLDPAADKHFALVRVMTGAHDDAVGYIPLLDHGWHVAPAYGEDNHNGNWGMGSGRMGVYASFLTRDGVKDAMRLMRTFTSSDRNGWVVLRAEDESGDLWMGSTVAGPGPIALHVMGGDDDDALDHVEIVSTGGRVVASLSAAGQQSFDWTVAVDPPGDAYFYARVFEADGDITYSAPIFVDR
jgi:hypothetical protein